MQTYNIHEAKTHLSKILEDVAAGKEVIIAKYDDPIAVLKPYQKQKQPRKPGALKGKIKIAKDFDVLPKSFTKHFGY